MSAKLYVMGVSHPAQAARRMLEHKGIDHKLVKLDLVGGLHDVPLKAMGFKDRTVPALKIGDQKIQGSMAISKALDEIQPESPLFPADPELRAKVEAAEAWGHDVFQQVPREIAVAALVDNPQARANFAKLLGFPGAIGPALKPIVKRMAGNAETNPEVAQRVLGELPGHLDHIDALIADGVIGGPELNAADCQIGASVRLLLTLEDTAPYVAGRPAEAFARKVFPDFAGPIPAGTIPSAWLAAAPA